MMDSRHELLDGAAKKIAQFLIDNKFESSDGGSWSHYVKVAAEAMASAPREVLMQIAADDTHLQIDSIGLVRVFDSDNVLLAKCILNNKSGHDPQP